MALTKIKTGGIADNAITNAKMADDAIDSADFVDGSIDNAHLAGSIAVSKTLLSAGAGLTLSTNSLAVDADQSGQITQVGTLTALTGGTGDLVWDTTTLVVDSSENRVGIGTASPASALHVIHASSEIMRLGYNDTVYNSLTTDTTNLVHGSGTQSHAWKQDGTTWMAVNEDGEMYFANNVGIGYASPTAPLEIRGSTTASTRILAIGTNSTATTFSVNSAGTAAATYDATGTAVCNIGSATSGNLEVSLTTKGSCELATVAGGHVTVVAGNLVIGTSGKGIDFSATADGGVSTPSELLDDYEEGTWTPATAFPYGSIAVQSHVSKYTKIGRVVYITTYIDWGSPSTGPGPSGEFRLGGLPFNPNDDGGATHISVACANVNYANPVIFGLSIGATSYIRLFEQVDDGQILDLNPSLVDGDSSVRIAGFYWV